MSRLDLEQQRKRAKDLLKAHRRGDREAAERIARQLPRARALSIDRVLALPLQLADAQLVIAREAGFASWPRLKRHVEHTAEERVPLHEAVRAGDLAAVRRALEHDSLPWQTREAIQDAILRDDRAIVRELLAHAGWVDTAGRAYGRWGGGLHTALLLGRDVAMIDELLAGGASVAARDRDGRTPLSIAVRTFHQEAWVALRRAGARDEEVDDVDRMLGMCIAGNHPARVTGRLRRSDHQHVAWAIRRGHLGALPALLAVGLDPSIPDDDGKTPLLLAVAARSLPAVEALLDAGARIDARDYTGETAIDRAVRLGDDAIVTRLAAAGASVAPPADLDELFEDAADTVVGGQLDRLRTLLDQEPRLVAHRSLREHRATLLHYTGANGVEHERQKSPPNAPAVAKLLLERGADPDALAMTYGGGPAQTTLYLAATSSFPDEAGIMTPLIEALVAGGAHVEYEDRDALHTSQPSALPALVAAGVAVDLWIAATLGRTADVRRMVRADGTLAPGAKVGGEATTPDAVIIDRAFLQACEAGDLEIVEILVAAGARLAGKDVVGFTGLHRAAWSDRLDIVRFLLGRGAPTDARTVYGGTVLGTLRWGLANDARHPRPHAAEIVALLLAAGAT